MKKSTLFLGKQIEVSIGKAYGLKLGIHKGTDMGSLVTENNDEILMEVCMTSKDYIQQWADSDVLVLL